MLMNNYINEHHQKTNDVFNGETKFKKPNWKSSKFLTSESSTLFSRKPNNFERFSTSNVESTSLVNFKITPTIHPEQLVRPFHGCGRGCCTSHSERYISCTAPKLGLRDLLKVPINNSKNFILTRHCAYVVYCASIKVPNNYPILNAKSILGDERVVEAIEKKVLEVMEERSVAKSKGSSLYMSLLSKYQRQASSLVGDMKAALSSTLIRIVGYVLFRVFSHLFMSVTVHEGQMEMLEKAAEQDIPIIFVPLHRSHTDYLFVTWVLFNRQIAAPVVAAGDNLRMPLFGSLLRGLGGFFIKRSLEQSKTRKDFVYRAVLQTYVSRVLCAGYNLEFFIEGGRTRTGKPCLPKGGLMSVVVDSFLSGSMDDALIVPVAINYDKIVDGDFIREQLGQKKVPESFWRAVRAIIRVLSTNYGHSRLDFAQPFSLREFFQSSSSVLKDSLTNGDCNNVSSPTHCLPAVGHHRSFSSPPIHGTSFPAPPVIGEHTFLQPTWSNSSLVSESSEEYRCFVRNLAAHVVYDAERCQAIMSTNAVAWLLSFVNRGGVTLDGLALSLGNLVERLRTKNRDTGFSGDSLHVAIHAITMLGPRMVEVTGDPYTDAPSAVEVRPCTDLPNVIELNYYANALAPLFALDGIVGTCVMKLSDCNLLSYRNVEMDSSISERELIENCTKLCNILRNEFYFAPPCGDVEAKLQDSIHELTVCGLLHRDEKISHHRRMYDEDDYNDEEDEGDQSWRRNSSYFSLRPTDENLQHISMTTSAIAPLIEAYYATVLKLDALLIAPCEDREFVSQVQELIRSLLHKGTISYGESVAADSIRNAMKMLESDGVLECHTQDVCRIVFLSGEFECSRRLRALQEEFASFRVGLL